MRTETARHNLAQKYNVAAPRYTSYPTMPYWDIDFFDQQSWTQSVKLSFEESKGNGISLYIHLPFCESLCTYCGCNTRITKNHVVEEPYINAVLREWEMYKQIIGESPVIREIHLGGGTPTFFSAQNLHLLINGILDGAQLHAKSEFSFEAHPGNTSAEHLQTLYNLGFRRLSLGIQDFDPKVQFIINRHQSFKQVQKVTEEARRIGYTSINYDLIYGLPLQTFEGLADTMHLVAELMPDRIAFYSYAHVPWLKPGQRRFTEHDLPNTHDKSKLQGIGRSLLKGYGYLEVGMDHFALPGDELLLAEHEGRLHRNFMGYTSQHTQLLIGLGVSSISDSGYAFAQNVKVVEDYLQMVNTGELPVFKGHIATAEDRAIRQQILDIMCKGEVRWDARQMRFDYFLPALIRLKSLADDGLVKLSAAGLIVNPVGKPFLRNICMAMDARQWRAEPSSQQFSM